MFRISLSLLTLLFCTSLWAHGPVHELILETTEKIKNDPNNAQLYIERGEFYRVDENFDAAYADFIKAEQLDSNLHFNVCFHLGHLFSEHGYPQSALLYMDQYLSEQPEHVKALTIRAGIYKQLGQDSLAVADFSRALEIAKEPRPHHFMEIAKGTLRADSTDFASAQYWLAKGEEALGFNIVLRTYAIEIHRKAGDYDAAIAEVDDIISRLPRHEKWLLEKATILEEAGRVEEAKVAYQATLDAISKLPRRNRSTRAVSEWQGMALQALARLE